VIEKQLIKTLSLIKEKPKKNVYFFCNLKIQLVMQAKITLSNGRTHLNLRHLFKEGGNSSNSSGQNKPLPNKVKLPR